MGVDGGPFRIPKASGVMLIVFRAYLSLFRSKRWFHSSLQEILVCFQNLMVNICTAAICSFMFVLILSFFALFFLPCSVLLSYYGFFVCDYPSGHINSLGLFQNSVYGIL